MFSRIKSAVIFGLKPYLIDVEVDFSKGLPCFVLVGCPAGEVKESAERVRIALKNINLTLPPVHIAVNLSPADIRKSGTGFDLPIALGVLSDMEMIRSDVLSDKLVLGEIGLNGEIKGVSGVMPMVWEAKKSGIAVCLVPEENAAEASVIEGVTVVGLKSLDEAIQYLNASKEEQERWRKPKRPELGDLNEEEIPDFSEVSGQESLKRGALIAAAGFHHLLIMGPPGTGKTMIAKRIPGILPPLDDKERMDVTAIYSIAGKLSDQHPVIQRRPFLNPHHGISPNALSGGGTVPQPGILSLANKGVLFLDELPEFSRGTLDMLREPLEEKQIRIARVSGSFTYPADIMLVGAMNPCPCGYYPDLNRCTCPPALRKSYASRISGPILDRMDLCLTADRVEVKQLQGSGKRTSSAELRARVLAARQRQIARYQGTSYSFNSSLDVKGIERFCFLGSREKALAEQICGRLELSARAYHRLLRVARTIADIEESDEILSAHLTEAVCYRPQLPGV